MTRALALALAALHAQIYFMWYETMSYDWTTYEWYEEYQCG